MGPSWSVLASRFVKRGATMIAWPWYLLSAGIALIIIGYFLDSFRRLGSGPRFIHPKMSDKKIKQIMNEEQGISLGSLVMLIGFLLVLVSIGWRLVRAFASFISTAR
jgi:uncharacterized membrane protein